MNGFKLTNEEIHRLDRLARENERHLKFLRHSPREQRWLPFVEERDMPEFKDAVIGAAMLIALVGTLIFLPAILGATS